MRNISTLIPLIVFTACATVSEDNLRMVTVGDTRDSVIAKLGQPESERNGTMLYSVLRSDRRSQDPWKIVLKDGKVTEIVFDTTRKMSEAELRKSRDNSSQACVPSSPVGDSSTHIKPDTCESAPPLK